MSAEHEIAAPAQLERIEFVSPWRAPSQAGPRRWLTRLAGAWREGMAIFARTGVYAGHDGWFR